MEECEPVVLFINGFEDRKKTRICGSGFVQHMEIPLLKRSKPDTFEWNGVLFLEALKEEECQYLLTKVSLNMEKRFY